MPNKPAAIFLTVVALCCFVVPAFGLDAYTMDPDATFAAPSAAHWLGTDAAGRDFLARLLVGGRVSLTVALIAGSLAVVIGAGLGTAAGWYGGVVDQLFLRVSETNLAVPKLPLMLLFAALDPGRFFEERSELGSIVTIVFVVALFGWTTAARLARAATLSARRADFVTAARALGLSDIAILRRHILPVAAPALGVAAMISLGDVILYESILSFLGLGVRPPVPSWGAMLSRGLADLVQAPHLIVVPGLLTFSVIAAFQVVLRGGDA